jgi:hypothetical protein
MNSIMQSIANESSRVSIAMLKEMKLGNLFR